ncbi:MAG: endonuclease [Dysgonamonadaceae bacterium]|jgi:endonuclease/exonuclease/phosphatase family metal-dependent hydrolase|nr:endonuclease [Dysgonamonadaceae bacterium]
MKNKKLLIVILTLSCCFPTGLFSQQKFRVVSYNVENLFDTNDDPAKDDSEFLPDGKRYWTYKRYANKLNNLARVIAVAGEWDIPAIVGLYEVENEKVMDDFTKRSPLKNQKYRYVMTNSEDARGIDVAMMYQRDQFKYLYHRSYRIRFPANPSRKTRDILHVTGCVMSGDTLDVFLCHFPSRRGGEVRSEPDRMYAASVVRSKVDSLFQIRRNANILIMGDFNDEPGNKSIYDVLRAKPYSVNMKSGDLCNLFYPYQKKQNTGTYKFGREWNMLDQIIVSVNLLNKKQQFHVLPETATIFTPSFIVTEDKVNGGKRPFKTYHGVKHEGGFSDHFPILLDFEVYFSDK